MKKSKSQRITKKALIAAIKAHGGNVAAVARELECTRKNLYAWFERNPDVQQARDDAREDFKDIVEAEALKQIKGGNTAMISLALKTKVRDRGWVEKQEVEHSGTVEAVYRVVTPRILDDDD